MKKKKIETKEECRYYRHLEGNCINQANIEYFGWEPLRCGFSIGGVCQYSEVRDENKS